MPSAMFRLASLLGAFAEKPSLLLGVAAVANDDLIPPPAGNAAKAGNAAIEVGWSASSQLMRAESPTMAEARPHHDRSHRSEAALLQTDASVSVKELARRATLSGKKASRHQANLTYRNPNTKVDLGWKPCDWQTPTNTENLHCKDGHICNPHEEQWTCCATHDGRLQCPKDFPRMCNQKNCGGNDYCCAEWCEYYDGDLPCTIAHKIYGMDAGWLTFLTRDAENNVIKEWADLTAGPMTWEIWYARRSQYPANTELGNAIMATYADNHNTNTYTSHNRRRNIGVYMQPKTGHLSMATFIGENVKDTPDPEDQFAGAHVVIGPAIADNDWHHIAVVWNLTEGKGWLYLDGVKHWEPVTYEPGNENPGLEGKLVIGGGHLGRTSTCQVSQFRLWRVPLAEEHISRIMECGEPDLPITDLKGFYRLSGDRENSVSSSGFLNLEYDGEEGLFAEGDPCVAGPPGFKGKDAFGGADGLTGEPGPPGIPGSASYIQGPPGEPGANGTQGEPGNSPPPPKHVWADASMSDFYICIGISGVITAIGAFLMYQNHVKGKASGASDTNALSEEYGGGGEVW